MISLLLFVSTYLVQTENIIIYILFNFLNTELISAVYSVFLFEVVAIVFNLSILLLKFLLFDDFLTLAFFSRIWMLIIFVGIAFAYISVSRFGKL